MVYCESFCSARTPDRHGKSGSQGCLHHIEVGVDVDIFLVFLVKIENVVLYITVMEDHIPLFTLESHLLATLLISVESEEDLLLIAEVFKSLPHRSFYKVLCFFSFQKVFVTEVNDTVMKLSNILAVDFINPIAGELVYHISNLHFYFIVRVLHRDKLA